MKLSLVVVALMVNSLVLAVEQKAEVKPADLKHAGQTPAVAESRPQAQLSTAQVLEILKQADKCEADPAAISSRTNQQMSDLLKSILPGTK